jgi:hypothetical protein
MKKASPKSVSAAACPTTLPRKDKLYFIGIPILLLGIVALLLHVGSTAQQNAAVTRTVTKWKTTYHFAEGQAERIKQIELDFHGNGSPFRIKPTRSKEEKHCHHEEISRLMSPEDGARFMKAMEQSEGKH